MEAQSQQKCFFFIISADREMMETQGERQMWQKDWDIRREGEKESLRGMDRKFPKEEEMTR